MYKDDELKNSASILGKEIDYGIRTYGIYHHQGGGGYMLTKPMALETTT